MRMAAPARGGATAAGEEVLTPTVKSNVQRERVIEAATELFWRRGYDGVSIGEVVDASGANRYALYQEFGGKKGVFMAVLDAYITSSRAMIGEYLARPGREPIDAVRDAIVSHMLDPAMFPAGCLMCTTAADVAAKDADVAELMARGSAQIAGDFMDAYAAAQAVGTAPAEGDPEAFAEIANALYFSTGLQARMGRSREDLLRALDAVVDSLRLNPSA